MLRPPMFDAFRSTPAAMPSAVRVRPPLRSVRPSACRLIVGSRAALGALNLGFGLGGARLARQVFRRDLHRLRDLRAAAVAAGIAEHRRRHHAAGVAPGQEGDLRQAQGAVRAQRGHAVLGAGDFEPGPGHLAIVAEPGTGAILGLLRKPAGIAGILLGQRDLAVGDLDIEERLGDVEGQRLDRHLQVRDSPHPGLRRGFDLAADHPPVIEHLRDGQGDPGAVGIGGIAVRRHVDAGIIGIARGLDPERAAGHLLALGGDRRVKLGRQPKRLRQAHLRRERGRRQAERQRCGGAGTAEKPAKAGESGSYHRSLSMGVSGRRSSKASGLSAVGASSVLASSSGPPTALSVPGDTSAPSA